MRLPFFYGWIVVASWFIALARGQQSLEIPAQEFLARRGLGHRIPARIAHLCNMRFYTGSDTAGAGHNTGT
jgi:hypothetical protein